MADWQPIDTCPKEEMESEHRHRSFDLWVEHRNWRNEFGTYYGYRIPDAHFDYRETRVPRWVDADGDTIEVDGVVITHWMPRPLGPHGKPEGEVKNDANASDKPMT